jgi:transcriptional regulator with XRE-family HTH domain
MGTNSKDPGIVECLASNIRLLRNEQGLTQSELAQRAGISMIFLQGIETGKKWISPTTVKSIAKALGVSESRLFENCFEEEEAVAPPKNVFRKYSRIFKSPLFNHVPDDVYSALITVCKHPSWKWDAIRWVLQGHAKDLGSKRQRQ